MSARLDLDDYLPYLLNRAGTKIADAFARVTRQHGISLQMWRVLAALQQQDGQSVGGLARTTSIDISTLSRLLDQMQKQHLLVRRRDNRDQRSVTIHRTRSATALTRKLIPVALDYEAKALAGFTARDAALTRRLLRRLYANLDLLAGIEVPSRHGRAASSLRRRN